MKELVDIVIAAIESFFERNDKYYRDYEMIERRFGLVSEPETLESISRSYGISRARVGQILERAFRKLKGRKSIQLSINKALVYKAELHCDIKRCG